LETLLAAFLGSHSNFRFVPHQYGTTAAADPRISAQDSMAG
jgi:hypothetical protein